MAIAATTKQKWSNFFVELNYRFALASYKFLVHISRVTIANAIEATDMERIVWCVVETLPAILTIILPAHAIVEFIGTHPQRNGHSDSNVPTIASRRLQTRRWCEFSNAHHFFMSHLRCIAAIVKLNHNDVSLSRCSPAVRRRRLLNARHINCQCYWYRHIGIDDASLIYPYPSEWYTSNTHKCTAQR